VDCLTPDVLAAWMDRTLSTAERSAAEAHAADCAHCQAMLAAMARTAPAPERRVWWSAPAVRWLVPVATAGLVVAVWVGVEREHHGGVPPSGRTMSAAIEPVKKSAPAEPARAEPQSSDANATSARDVRAEPAKMRTRTSDDAARRQAVAVDAITGAAAGQNRADALAPNAAPAQSPPVPATQPSAGVSPSALPPATAAPVPAPPPPPTPPTPTSRLPMQESVTIRGEAPLSKEAAPRAAAAVAGARARPVEVISPERSYRWQSLTPGSVLYSMDGGMNWHPSSTGASVVLHAGSAPSRTVCWFVGQAGTVLLTTDGQNWQVRSFPERVDLTEVRAANARSATVTTADRRKFATSDGGATWSPLQEN